MGPISNTIQSTHEAHKTHYESCHLPQWPAACTATADRPSAKNEENEVGRSLAERG